MITLKQITLVLMIFLTVPVFALRITEYFYRGDDRIRSEERFIELYNDTSEVLDLSKISIELPAGETSTVRVSPECFGGFVLRDSLPQTNSFLLKPAHYAVITSAYQAKNACLIVFDSNALLLSVSSRTAFTHSWTDRLHNVRIWNGEDLLYDASEMSFATPKAGESLHLSAQGYVSSSISAGWEAVGNLSADRRVLRGRETAVLTYREVGLDVKSVEAQVRLFPSGNIKNLCLDRISAGFYAVESGLWGEAHGSDALVICRDQKLLLRYLEERPLTSDFQNVMMNEIVPVPLKDYSGTYAAGWDGADHGGKITDTDDWIELVNRSTNTVNLSNFYILQRTTSSESIKTLSFRTGSGILSPHSYLIVTPSGGISANACLRLYNGHPYLDGRIVDEVEYGDYNGGDSKWNNAPGADEVLDQTEAIARIPNARAGTNGKEIFRRMPVSFAGMNGADRARMWAHANSNTMEIFVTDTNMRAECLRVNVRGLLDSEDLWLTNDGIFYHGYLPVKESQSGFVNNALLEVKNGERLHLVYTNLLTSDGACYELNWATDGWSLSRETATLDKVVLFPNPIRKGEILHIGNLPEGVSVRVVDKYGRVLADIAGFTEIQSGEISWKVPLTLEAGVLTILFRHGGALCIKKLWLH